MDAINAIDKFLSASECYRMEEPTRKAQLIALAERELELSESDEMRSLWLQKKAALEAS